VNDEWMEWDTEEGGSRCLMELLFVRYIGRNEDICIDQNCNRKTLEISFGALYRRIYCFLFSRVLYKCHQFSLWSVPFIVSLNFLPFKFFYQLYTRR
jgi:hypothetical protein